MGVTNNGVTKQYEYRVNYENCFKNNFKNDVETAVKFYLNSDNVDKFVCGTDVKIPYNEIVGFVLYPHALNPFLKIMETLKETRNIIIFPSFNNDNYDSNDDVNSPAYLILKICRSEFPTSIIVSDQ